MPPAKIMHLIRHAANDMLALLEAAQDQAWEVGEGMEEVEKLIDYVRAKLVELHARIPNR